MKILLSWLRDYLDIQMPPEKIAESLNMAGIEVEALHQLGKDIKGVVTGRILSREPHPNAEKLSLCLVDVGEPVSLSIVCGADNMKSGDIVPVAKIGASLPGGIEIRRAKIRGSESFGMMCSKRELGLSEDHSGLYILPADTPIGIDALKLLGLDDTVFDISITPNRGDALSHLGIARELSAIFNLPLHRKALDESHGDGEVSALTSVTMDAPQMCHRYGARIVEGVKIAPSPRWLCERLEKIGVRPINNVVDVTNYVMMDIGHPMHAFDLKKLDDGRIVVRMAKPGEKIKTLDGNQHGLESTMLVIADAKQPVAIAGVMGGENSEVDDSTTSVLLEAAWFDPVIVRKTAKTFGMMSESSYRFERGTNIDNVPIALNKAVSMILETAGGKAKAGMIDAYPVPHHVKKIVVRPRRVSQVLGVSFKPEQIETILNRLKFEVEREGETILVGIPPFRHDLEQEVDFIEEIARIYGYDNLPTTLPSIMAPPRKSSPITAIQNRLRDHLVSLGYHQLITYSFISGDIPVQMQEGLPLTLKNPISEEQGVLRTTLMWGMYDALRRNILADEYDLRFFEMGRVFQRNGENTVEPDRLSIGISGRANPRDWRRCNEAHDLYELKGLLEGIGRLNGHVLEFRNSSRDVFHPSRQMEVRVGGFLIGCLGQIHPRFLDNKKMPAHIYLAEIDLSGFAGLSSQTPRMKPISEFPAVQRDLALVLPIETVCEDVRQALVTEGGTLLESCALFDVYQGKGIDPGSRSLAFSLVFRAGERTLTEADVQPRIEAMTAVIEKKFHGKLRAG
ncbi:MAG: phenylalanine--tRNA ligase subunit beta [Candidatus Riflebacteria bacterium]|nr:phenylalanine--tRNA ligase subunit beta [Candidatus Riflebacteria bacterium]